jgi:Protein of unknown function (DUF3096)
VGCSEDARKRDEIISITVRGAAAQQESSMSLNLSIAPLVALLAGILILVMPRLLNYIVALYLIIIGVLGLLGSSGSFHLH